MTYDLMKQESPSPMCMLRWERVWMQHMHINLCRLIWVSSLQSFIIFIFWLRYSSHVLWDKINISATHIELLKDFYDIICFSFFVFFWTFITQGNSTRSHLCPPGHYCPVGTGQPLPCPAGSLSTSQGRKGDEECSPCPPGAFCDRPALAELSDALPCHAG